MMLLILSLLLLGLLMAFDALLHARTSQAAIAWIFSLTSVPYLAIPSYLVFGRHRFQVYVEARQSALQTVRAQSEKLKTNNQSYTVDSSEMTDSMRSVESLGRMPILRGNEIGLLIDGEITFESIFAGVDEAKKYILVQFYIVHDDNLGRRLNAKLIEQAQKGIQVYFLYDEIGSHKLPKNYLQGLRDAGVKTSAFNTRKGRRNRFQINFRNHRKIVVVDGNTAWLGGHNVGDEYLGKDPHFGPWRDTHVKVKGPAALEAQLSFVEDWYWATEEIPPLSWQSTPAKDGDTKALILPTGPADQFETATLMFMETINQAKNRVWIASPYFVPDLGMIHTLQLAALRGVDVRILIPAKADNLLVHFAAHTNFATLLESEVKIYRYNEGFLHQKVILIDEATSVVGTANFDNRSFRLNFEVSTFVFSEKFNQVVKTMLEQDFARSCQVTLEDSLSDSLWFRLKVRASNLFSSVL
jgi:cardiolipin synthase